MDSMAQMRQLYVDNIYPDNEINKISFYSASEGYIAFNRWIGYTTDSGKTFVQKPVTLSNVDYNGYSVNLTFGFGINGVKAFSHDSVIAYGDYGLVPAVLYSTDGCNTFKLIFQSQYNPLTVSTGITDMVFPQNGNIGYAVDADRILKTADRGGTWAPVRVVPGAFFNALEAVDDNNAIAFNTDNQSSQLFRTTNAGATWQSVNLPAPGKLEYAHFITPNNGWLDLEDADQNGNLYYTSNGGISWVRKNDPLVTPFLCDKMRFINDSTGFALAGLFSVYRTSDSGKIWEPLPRDNTFTYLGYSHNDLHFRGASQFWAGGGHGFLEVNTNPGGMTLPRAFFRIDTTNILSTNTVNLLNYSRPGYQYKWYQNSTLISTAYHASYIHNIFQLRDTIRLVVSNGVNTDTALLYQNFYPPVIVSSFAPVLGGAGSVITINGANFSDVTSVSFGGTPAASFTVVSSTSISAVVGTGASGNVVVRTTTGIGSLAGFVFLPPPSITSFTPTSAIAGTTISITGTNFTGATAVRFGGEAASSFTVVSSTTITAIPGPGLSGSVTVVTPGGMDSLQGFTELPSISAFSPASGTNGTVLGITGTGLTDVTGVSVGGIAARSFVINSPDSITAIVGAGATGIVTVTTGAGTSSLPGFTFFLPPVISSFSPASAAVGATVTITGSNFSAVAARNTVYFGAVRAVVSAATTTTLTVTVPAGASFQPITVTTNNLTAWSGRPFPLIFPGGGSITPHSFAPKSDFSSGETFSSPYSVAVGDLDGDGKPDMAVANLASYSISVLRNTTTAGVLSFDTKVEYPAIDESNNIFMADIDGDGKLDVIVANQGSQTLLIFRNTSVPGTISFDTRMDLTAPVNAGSVTISDVDGDGKPDLIITDLPYSRISILINNGETGHISFSPAQQMSVAGGNGLTVSDIDGDGKPDLIMLHITSNLVSVSRNTSTIGNPSFAPALDLGTTYPYWIFAGDIDGDGKPDIVCPNPLVNTVSVFRNTSAGAISFAAPLTFSTGNTPVNISMGDLDGDGKIDLVTANSNDTTVSVFKNISVPGLISFGDRVNFQTGNYPQCIAIGDMDGDGKYDLVVADQTSASVSVLRNTVVAEPFVSSFTPTIGIAGTAVTISGNNFSGVSSVSFGGAESTSFVVNSSSSITAIVGAGAAGDVTVTNSYGSGTKSGFAFGLPPVISVFSPASGPVGTTLTITGSGFSAVSAENIVYFGGVRAVVSSSTPASLVVIVPAGATYDPITVTTAGLTGYSAQPFLVTFPGAEASFSKYSFDTRVEIPGGNSGVVGDLDGDGKLDIAYRTFTGSIAVARNTSTRRKISFAPSMNFVTGPTVLGIAIGDLDGDGKPDLVGCNYGGASISILQNTGNPGSLSFAPHQDFSTGSQAAPIAAAIVDLDEDGKPDIAVINYTYRTLSIFRNTSIGGHISFALRVDYGLGGYPINLSVNDLDGDGKPDIAISMNSAGGIASVFRNTSIAGNISFGQRLDLAAVGDGPNDIKTGDLDGDGKPDIAVVLINSNSLVLFKNTSMGGNLSFSGPVQLVTGYGPNALSMGDLDGDAKPDVVTSNNMFSYTIPNSVSLLKNNSAGGNISFQPRLDYNRDGVGYPWSSTIGDIDGDGKPDLILYTDAAPIAILRNQISEPYIASFAPATAYTGTSITIKGAKFSGVTGVSFGGVPASSFTVVSDSSILAVVGSGASGTLMVMTPTDTAESKGFTFIPVPVITPATSAAICQGQAVILRSSVAGGNQWYQNGVPLNGATADSLAAVASGTYTVMVTVNGVTTPPSNAVVLTVNSVPQPIITMDILDSLVVAYPTPSGYQWYTDTTAVIPGANKIKYKPSSPGYYSVKVTQNGCTSVFSERFHYLATAVINLGGPNNYISFTPNPARDFILVSFALPGIDVLDIGLSDLNGRQVISKKDVHAGDRLDISGLANGLYLIRVRSRNGKISVATEVIKF